MSDEKKRSQEFHHFHELEEGLQCSILRFLSPEDLATRVAPASKKINARSNENYTWEIHVIDEYKETESTKENFRNQPLARLSKFHPYLEELGEKGAALCRDVLRVNPGHIQAQSRLAFLQAMGEATRREDLHERAPRVILQENWQNHRDLETGYYLAKLAIESEAPDVDFITNIFSQILRTNREHLDVLCDLANLTHRREISAGMTDSLFPGSEPSRLPHPNSAIYDPILKARALALYQKAKTAHPDKNHEILCSLASSLRKSPLFFYASDFQRYATFIDPDTPHLPLDGLEIRHQLAALCYRKILSEKPKHLEAVIGLAHLIGDRLIPAETDDFLPEERINQHMPGTLYDKELALFRRIAGKHDKAKHPEIYKKVFEIPIDLWPDHLRPHMANFKNLTYSQRVQLSIRVTLAQDNYLQNTDRAARVKILNKQMISTFPYFVAIISTFALMPLYFMADQLNTVRVLSLAGVASLQFVLLAICAYFSIKRINENDFWDKEVPKGTVLRFSADDEVLPILYPDFDDTQTQQDKKILRRLWEIPAEKWRVESAHKKTLIYRFFSQSTQEEKQLLANRIQAVDQQVVSNYSQVKIAKAMETTGKLLLPLLMLAASGYGTYKIYGLDRSHNNTDLVDPIIVSSFTVVIALIFTACTYYWIKTVWNPKLVEKAEKSVRDDLIIASVNPQTI